MAFFQLCSFISSETPSIEKSSLEYLFKRSARSGFSTLQGAHHDAQKSIKIYLDLIPLREITSPLSPGPENLGAKDPILGTSELDNL